MTARTCPWCGDAFFHRTNCPSGQRGRLDFATLPPASPTNPLLTSDTLGVEAPTDREQAIERRSKSAGYVFAKDDVEYLLARVRSLRANLDKYADHLMGCGFDNADHDCDCGLLVALSPEAPANGQ